MTLPPGFDVRRVLGLVAGIVVLGAGSAFAQGTAAAGAAASEDTPTVKVGFVLFTDYTYTSEPTLVDVDGNEVNPASFDVKRAYINVTGDLSRRISFRVTPDIIRETTTVKDPGGTGVKVSTNLDGSLTYRLKYAYGQYNLDEAWSKGSWVRLGENPTPYVLFEEDVYRYRFQGPIMVDAEKFMTSSDFGLSTHYNFPGNYGDVHGGYYNGDGYSKADPNDQQAIQVRATLRPVPNGGAIKGLRLTVFYDADHYVQNDDRTRLVGFVSFEHKYVNAGLVHLDATDQATAASAKVKAEGWSAWVTPRFPKGWEGLLRFDSFKPDRSVDAKKERRIAGIAYWFTTRKPASASLLLDFEEVTYDPTLATADEKRYALHALFSY